MTDNSQTSSKPFFIEIDEEGAGQRIDNFLFTRLKGVPKSHVYRILRKGEVRVNGGRCQAQRRLEAGDKLRIPPVRLAEREERELPETMIQQRLDGRILHEDDDFLVVNKPAGMAVHGGSGLSYGIIEGLRALRPQAKFLELVHRLDRETSGCLLIAKKRSALRHLHEMFREDHQVKKTYIALLSGVWARKSLLVDAPLKKNILQSGERMVKVAKDGKPARTEFRRLRKFASATLVEASPLTGRTHQIRVHALSIGHPIACDERYGDVAQNLEFRKMGLKRLFLHASELAFAHPRDNRPFQIKAPLEHELQEFVDRLAP
ncbi:MAG: 23S rRNA pseudouridine(955/2504/2580) synthase RluC [Proteobacteria bacterium]|nr:23S rRNA pseudouridine(955/2504/2580) synthase RluC [Pseudomonadota bacterium]